MRVLTRAESSRWSDFLDEKALIASPIAFALADEGAFCIEVGNGRGAGGGKTLIIHVFKRPDVPMPLAITVCQHALVDIFGAEGGREAECDYREYAEGKRLHGEENVIREEMDSLTIIFKPGIIASTRSPTWVRDRMAHFLGLWFSRLRR